MKKKDLRKEIVRALEGKKKFNVVFNMGYLEYEVEAENEEEAIEKATKERLADGYQSPTSELESVKQIDDD